MPADLSQAFGLSASRVSMLMATTSKSGPPSLFCSASSAGISLRHGTHQVAHRLSSTTRPFQSASVLSAPAASLKASGGTRRASSVTLSAATSPRASGAMRLAISIAGRQAGSPPLPPKPAIPYTPASPSAVIATAASAAYLRRLRGAGVLSSASSDPTVMFEQTVDVPTLDQPALDRL